MFFVHNEFSQHLKSQHALELNLQIVSTFLRSDILVPKTCRIFEFT